MDGWCDCSYIPWDVQGLDQFYLLYYKMEKLLQLLNEYLWQSGIVAIDQEIEWGRDIFFENVDWFHAEEAEIISKKFWFIEWLVANDKLNKEWLFNIIRESCIFDDMNICPESDYIIMYLAIGYNPIYFLTSMVK